MHGLDKRDLFELKPLPKAALTEDIVSDNAKLYNERTKSFYFKAIQQSRFPGKLVSFGSLPKLNDFYLPDEEFSQFVSLPASKPIHAKIFDRHRFKGFKSNLSRGRVHCQFFLTLNGDLMIEDLTSGHHATMECIDNGKTMSRYSLQGDPRRRVIPRGLPGEIQIRMGVGVAFHFKWALPMEEEQDVRHWGDRLSELAHSMHKPGRGMGLTRPFAPNIPDTEYEQPARYTPKPVAKDDRDRLLMKFHKYGKGDAAEFRVVRTSGGKNDSVRDTYVYQARVHRAVDLATGDICAVKECAVPPDMLKDPAEPWKADLKLEVEKLLALKHPYILELVHHQGWSTGLKVQLVFKATKSSVFALCHRHDYLHLSKPPPAWLPRFTDQILQAIAFLHRKEYVHRNIRPQTIVFVEEQGEMTFQLTGLEHAAKQREIRTARPQGQPPYMAPEMTSSGHAVTDQPGDMYAFGITLLEVLGIFCPQEVQQDAQEWAIKLKMNRIKQWASYREDPNLSKSKVGYSRVGALCEHGLVRRSVARVLEQDPNERSTAEVARRDLLAEYRPRRVRDSSASRDGRPPSRQSDTSCSPAAERPGRGPCPPQSSVGRSRPGRDGSVAAKSSRSKRHHSRDSGW